MTFKHRLSRRLAVLRPGLALLFALGLSACAAEDQLPLGPQDPGAPPEDDLTFEIIPPSMVLEIGQQARFLGLDLHEHPPYPPVFEGGYPPPPAWHPGRMLLRWRLRGETRKLRQRYGIDLDAD